MWYIGVMNSNTSPLSGTARATGHCRCCNQPYNLRGIQRARENRDWPRDIDAGEHDTPHAPGAVSR